jgi:2'-5' RNA ligase
MRLFVAVVPPANVLAELAMATEPLRLAAPGLRWAGTENWHLTLAFLGEVGEPALAGLSTRLERAARRHPPQRLALAGGGAFPAAARARVLWAGVEADRRALGRLAASVAAGARRAGAAPPDEGRKFRAHLTLARSAAPADLTSVVTGLRTFASTAWTADSVQLVRSHLGNGAPRYEAVGSWPLAAALATRRGAGAR